MSDDVKRQVKVYWNSPTGGEEERTYNATHFEYLDGGSLELADDEDDEVAIFAAGRWLRAEIVEP